MSFVAVELANLLNEKYHIGDDPDAVAATEGLYLFGAVKAPADRARRLYTGDGRFVIFHVARHEYQDTTEEKMAQWIREEFGL